MHWLFLVVYYEYMRYFVKNPGGRVSEVNEPEDVDKWLRQGFTLPTPDEINTYCKSIEDSYRAQQLSIEREKNNTGADGVYFATVSTGQKNGYSVSALHIFEELQKLDVPISMEYSGQKVALLYHMPYSLSHIESPIKLVYTMFDSSRIPADWHDHLAIADKILVPSKWNQKVFKDCGFDTEVVPLGYDSDKLHFVERPKFDGLDKTFTFLHYDAFNLRKGFNEVFKAFVNEFCHWNGERYESLGNVKMIFKTTRQPAPLPIPPSIYPNIEVITGPMTDTELYEIIERSDCFVFPSHGEGFGLTPVEAMATGIPAIVPNAHGISEYFNPACMYEVEIEGPGDPIYRGTQFKNENLGHMLQPSVASIQKQMCYAYEHPDEVREKGKFASEWVKQWTYKKTALKLKKILDEALAMDPADKPIEKVLPMIKV